MEVPDDEVSRYGVIKGDPVNKNDDNRIYDLEDMVEKPSLKDAPSNLAIIGRYVLTPTIFDALMQIGSGSGGEIQLTDALRLLSSKEKVMGYRFSGKRHDAGDKLGFLMATVEFALKNEELGPSFRKYLRSLDLNK